MKTALTVSLADLRYNYSGYLANDCMPLGVGYMKAVMDRDLPEVRSHLFVYPDRLWDAIKNDPPDVLMLSDYCWNEALSLHFARLAKQIRPDTLVVLGGPNISIEPERQIAFVRAHPYVDVYILGEGDFLAAEVAKHYLEADKSIAKLGERDIPSAVYRRNGEVIRTSTWNRHKEVDDIPSPWVTGVLDEFFDGKLAPLMETNRGCPFTCTFCVQGTGWYTKVHNFSIERVKQELEYIARRITSVCPAMGTLRLADSNYGMYERDVEISGFIGELMKEYKWPTYVDATTGKNRPERIIQSVEKVSGALILYQAVQSLDENVLRNVKRSTIKLEAYEQLLVHMRGRGMRSNSDLILALPGETLQTHVAALHKLLDAGVSQVNNFQLMMLKGSELETLETRRQFGFQTRYRILPKNFGIYGGEKVFDVEEIVVATDTLPFEDYVQARKYLLVSAAFWRTDYLEIALQFAEKFGVKRSAWLDRTLQAMHQSQGTMREFLDNFVAQTIGELFPTKEACIEFYSQPANFDRLQRGEVGENLANLHNAMASFYIWPEICKMGMDVTRQLMEERQVDQEVPNFDEFWNDLHRFLELRHASGRAVEQVMAPSRACLSYDFERWVADGAPKDPSSYRLPEPREFEFKLSEEGVRGLSGMFNVWSTSAQGLAKLVTRINPNWQVKECRLVEGAVPDERAMYAQ